MINIAFKAPCAGNWSGIARTGSPKHYWGEHHFGVENEGADNQGIHLPLLMKLLDCCCVHAALDQAKWGGRRSCLQQCYGVVCGQQKEVNIFNSGLQNGLRCPEET